MNDGALNYNDSTLRNSYKSNGEREYALFLGTLKYLGILVFVTMIGQMSLMAFGIITLFSATINMVKWADPDVEEAKLKF